MRSRSWPAHRGRGQATVELALTFPVLILAVLLVLQMALLGRDVILVHHAAREAARRAAVDDRPDRAAVTGARVASTSLDPARLRVDTDVGRTRVRVSVRYRAITGLPIVGALVPDPELTASAVMRRE